MGGGGVVMKEGLFRIASSTEKEEMIRTGVCMCVSSRRIYFHLSSSG